MTKREAAIISAYTGMLVGDYDEYIKYVEEKLNGEPSWGQSILKIQKEIRDAAKEDFMNLDIDGVPNKMLLGWNGEPDIY